MLRERTADYKIVFHLSALPPPPLHPRSCNNSYVCSAIFPMRVHRSGASGRGLIGIMRFKFIQLKIIILPLCVRRETCKAELRCGVNKLSPRVIMDEGRRSRTCIPYAWMPTEVSSSFRLYDPRFFLNATDRNLIFPSFSFTLK